MTIDYADGAESAVLAALRAAADVSAGSAELAPLARSWETVYHFSPARLGLLAPLRITPGLRVVDLGCGSGVLSRTLGEAGASVVGIEGVPSRAAAARERCRDLPDVRIVSATLADGLRDAGPFDLALICGVLEYNDPFTLLPAVMNSLSDNGVVVLAIENQLGLRYLLGGAEDHHGKAWVGLTDYPRGEHVPATRTYTRRTLHGLLAGAGLTAQRWLLPYPDYKLPRVVLDETAFRHGPELVEKLVRDPLQGSFGGNDAAVSGRIAHRLAMGEGIGPVVAPSFLVVASRNPAALSTVVEPGLAWLISGTRRPAFRRTRKLNPDFTLQTVHSGLGTTGSWLRQEHLVSEPLRPGRAMDAYLLEAMRRNDSGELTRLLDLWRRTCLARARPLDPADLPHAFLPHRPGVPVLPPDHLDMHPGNLIIGPGGAVTRVDLEWHAGTGVDAELVLMRALLEFAREVVRGHAPHPWPARSVRGVFAELCALTGLGTALADRWDELVAAEAALQELVTGLPADRGAADIEQDADASDGEPLWQLPGGIRALRENAAGRRAAEQERDAAIARQHELSEHIARQGTHIADLTDRIALTEHGLSMARSELDLKDDRIGRAFNELATAVREAARAWETNERTEAARAAAEAEAAALRERLNRTRARLDALENSKLVRTAHKSLWPAGRLVRGVRDLALGRPGDEPDGLLRRLGQEAPKVAAAVSGRYRSRAAAARDAGLHFELPVPAGVAVGAGQVLELVGWVTHASVGVRSVSVRAGDREVPASRGHYRPDVAAALRPGGVRVPDGSGVTVRIPVASVDAPGVLPLELLVTLDDGTVLSRGLPTVTLSATNLSPVAARWPSDGPKVAICMATYRPDPVFLAQQLESIRAQKHPNWVCVISDDASGDDHVATIRRLVDGDDRFVLVANEENVGFYRNFERALTLTPADADLVALSDQDDIWDADKLDTLVERFHDPAVTLAYADMRLIDEHDELIARSFWRHRENQWTDLDALLLLNTMTGAASMMRADVVREQVLPFPPGTPSAFHDQWTAVVSLAAGRIEYVDRPLHSYRQHGDAVSGRRDNRLDEGLPSGLGWLRMLRGGDDPELETVADYELRRVAQFTTVLLMRQWNRLGAIRERLAELTRIERDLKPLVTRARANRPQTAGAERRLLAAAMRWKSLRGKRLRVPARPPLPLD
jgi:SAM-dependent methyltransferase